mgnify:CR=1 FL=1
MPLYSRRISHFKVAWLFSCLINIDRSIADEITVVSATLQQ